MIGIPMICIQKNTPDLFRSQYVLVLPDMENYEPLVDSHEKRKIDKRPEAGEAVRHKHKLEKICFASRVYVNKLFVCFYFYS